MKFVSVVLAKDIPTDSITAGWLGGVFFVALAVAVHGIAMADISVSDRVAIVGGGTIGLCAVAIARRAAAARAGPEGIAVACSARGIRALSRLREWAASLATHEPSLGPNGAWLEARSRETRRPRRRLN